MEIVFDEQNLVELIVSQCWFKVYDGRYRIDREKKEVYYSVLGVENESVLRETFDKVISDFINKKNQTLGVECSDIEYVGICR